MHGSECGEFHEHLLPYLQLLSHGLACPQPAPHPSHWQPHPQPHQGQGQGQGQAYASVEQVLQALRGLHAAHTLARRSLFLWLNSATHCSLVRPFAQVSPAQLNQIYDAHLAAQAQASSSFSAPPASPIDLQTILLNMQSAGESFPSFVALCAALSLPSTLVRFGVRRADFLEEVSAREVEARQQELARTAAQAVQEAQRAHQHQIEALRATISQHQRERDADAANAAAVAAQREAAMQAQYQALQAEVESLRSQLLLLAASPVPASSYASPSHPSVPVPAPAPAAPGPVPPPPLSDSDQSALVSYLGECQLFALVSESGGGGGGELSIQADSLDALVFAGGGDLGATIHAMRTLDQQGRRFSNFEQLIPAVKEVAEATPAAANTPAAAAAAATNAATEAAAMSPAGSTTVSSLAIDATNSSSDSAAAAAADDADDAAAVAADLTDAETALFVDYLGQCLLFSELNEADGALRVEASSLSSLSRACGGLNNTLFLLKGLDALGRKFHSFGALQPELVAAFNQQQISAEAQKRNQATPVATPTAAQQPHFGFEPHVTASVGAPVVSATQLPTDSPTI